MNLLNTTLAAICVALPVLASVPAFGAVRPGKNAITPAATSRPGAHDYTETTRTLNQATKDGATTTKVGGSTIMNDETGGTGTVAPTTNGVPPDQAARTAKQELKSGTASTGGTGTSLDDAGPGSNSNTTGSGSMGSDSGR